LTHHGLACASQAPSILAGRLEAFTSEGMMKRRAEAFRAAVLTAGLLGTPTLAHAQLSESPITPGFWSFPSQKTKIGKDVIAACRDHFEIRFANGHFIGLRMRRTEQGLVQREVEDVGRRVFNRETQIDQCSVRITHSDGSILAGTFKSKHSLDADHALTMSVTPEMITDSPSSNAPYQVFPVHCPDEAIWSILNESTTVK
jgi:hypothetical protein